MENNKERKFGRKVMWLINLGLITAGFYAVLFGPGEIAETGKLWVIYAGLSSMGTLFVDGFVTWTDIKGSLPFAQK